MTDRTGDMAPARKAVTVMTWPQDSVYAEWDRELEDWEMWVLTIDPHCLYRPTGRPVINYCSEQAKGLVVFSVDWDSEREAETCYGPND